MAKRPSSRGRAVIHPASRVMLIRQIHAYLSVFVAPIILFFAFTGMVQLFSLHEAHGDYQPPPLIEKLGTLHKDQRFALQPKRHEPSARPPMEGGEGVAAKGARGEGDWVAPLAKAPTHESDTGPTPREMALKVMFCAAAAMLIVSTLLGVWMAVTQNRRKWLLVLLLLLGAASPVAILLL